MKNLKAVIFDLGDTLIHGNFTAGASEEIWEEVYARLINPLALQDITPLKVLRSAWQTHVQSAMARTWQEKTEKELEFLPLIQTAFREARFPQADDLDFMQQVVALEHHLIYERLVEVAPDALTTLTALRQRGYRLGLVSNFCNLPEVAYTNIRQIGLLDLFDAALLSCEIGWRKPAPIIYETMCERLGVAPSECLFVGDRLVEDIQGPQTLGMRAVQSRQFRQEEPNPAIRPDAVIEGLDELLAIVTA